MPVLEIPFGSSPRSLALRPGRGSSGRAARFQMSAGVVQKSVGQPDGIHSPAAFAH